MKIDINLPRFPVFPEMAPPLYTPVDTIRALSLDTISTKLLAVNRCVETLAQRSLPRRQKLQISIASNFTVIFSSNKKAR